MTNTANTQNPRPRMQKGPNPIPSRKSSVTPDAKPAPTQGGDQAHGTEQPKTTYQRAQRAGTEVVKALNNFLATTSELVSNVESALPGTSNAAVACAFAVGADYVAPKNGGQSSTLHQTFSSLAFSQTEQSLAKGGQSSSTFHHGPSPHGGQAITPYPTSNSATYPQPVQSPEKVDLSSTACRSPSPRGEQASTEASGSQSSEPNFDEDLDALKIS